LEYEATDFQQKLKKLKMAHKAQPWLMFDQLVVFIKTNFSETQNRLQKLLTRELRIIAKPLYHHWCEEQLESCQELLELYIEV